MKTLSDIDISTTDGKLLFAALTILTVSPELHILGQTVRGSATTPDEMIGYLETVADSMHFDSQPENVFSDLSTESITK